MVIKIKWDVISDHAAESSIVPFMHENFNENRAGAWRLYLD